MKKYHSDEGWAKIQERRPHWSPELQERVSREWTELFRDVEAALDEDPAGARAQALSARWRKLIEEFTGSDREITTGVKNLWADRPNWPAEFQQQAAPFSNPRVWEFMGRVLEWKE
jgi:TipAS antibiotic-recognition domain